MTTDKAPVTPLVTIILPTYNEKGNIEKLVPALHAVMPCPTEYLVVDDDSPDGTAEAVRALMPDLPELRLIVRTGERGLVSAIQRGIDESRGAIVVWMDCDFSLPPATVPLLVAEITAQGRDAAIGSRYVPGGADETVNLQGPLVLFQKIATSILNRLTCLIMRADFHDWTSGFIAIRAEVIKKHPLQGDYGEYFIMLMAGLIREGHNWVEVPYRNVPRTVGDSKTADSLGGLLRRGIRYLIHVFRARQLLTRTASSRDHHTKTFNP
jgi:dolichol-phosphate mannosyltransferase